MAHQNKESIQLYPSITTSQEECRFLKIEINHDTYLKSSIVNSKNVNCE